MTSPFDRTPKGPEAHHLHAVLGPPPDALLRRRERQTDDGGALVFSLLTLEAEDRS